MDGVEVIKNVEQVITERFREEFFRIIREKDITRPELGKELGLNNSSSVSRVLNGIYKVPSTCIWLMVAKYNVTPAVFFSSPAEVSA